MGLTRKRQRPSRLRVLQRIERFFRPAWQIVTADMTMSPGNGYIVDALPDPNVRVMLALPDSMLLGEQIIVIAKSPGGFRIVQSALDQMRIAGGGDHTTPGAAGYVQSSSANDSVEITGDGGHDYNVRMYGCAAN